VGGDHDQDHILAGHDAPKIVGRKEVFRKGDARQKNPVFTVADDGIPDLRFKHPEIHGIALGSQQIGQGRSPGAAADHADFHLMDVFIHHLYPYPPLLPRRLI